MDAVDKAEILKRYHAGDRPLDISAEMSIPVTEVRTVIREADAGLPAVLTAERPTAPTAPRPMSPPAEPKHTAPQRNQEPPAKRQVSAVIVQETRTQTPATQETPRQPEPPAATRDPRVEHMLGEAAQSTRQRTRTMGARLEAVLEDLRRALYFEAAVRVEQERVDRLVEELAQARLALKGKQAELGPP